MNTFLIQTMEGRVKHDFSFHLLEAIDYQNWYYREKIFDFVLSDEFISDDKFIPVGSLEFVFQFLEQTHQLNKNTINPINIPFSLRKSEFLKRHLSFLPKNQIQLTKPTFVKSHSVYKSFTDVIDGTFPLETLPNHEFMVSDVVEIDSEWRIFVHVGKMVGLHHYTGDFTLFPDTSLIENMIRSYENAPLSYTLDIGMNDSGTFVIEVHPFVSCGLYGFRDYRILPQMFVNGFQFLLNEK